MGHSHPAWCHLFHLALPSQALLAIGGLLQVGQRSGDGSHDGPCCQMADVLSC